MSNVLSAGLPGGDAIATVVGAAPDQANDAAHDVGGLHRTPLQDTLLLPGELPRSSGPLLPHQSHRQIPDGTSQQMVCTYQKLYSLCM